MQTKKYPVEKTDEVDGPTHVLGDVLPEQDGGCEGRCSEGRMEAQLRGA